MPITVEINGTVASIILSGGIDYSTQEEFKQANIQALSADSLSEIHVNFAETTFWILPASAPWSCFKRKRMHQVNH